MRQSSELSKEDMRKVISVHFTPATSVTRWLLEKESQFRAAIAGILSHTKFVVSVDTFIMNINENVKLNDLHCISAPRKLSESRSERLR